MADYKFPPIIAREGAMLIKEESPHGTDASPVAAGNSVLVFDVELKPNIDVKAPTFFKPWGGKREVVTGVCYYDISFKHYLSGYGDGGTAKPLVPYYDPALKAAMWQYNATSLPGAESNVDPLIYSPVTQQDKACTIYLYFQHTSSNAQLFELDGCALESKFVFDPANGAPIVEYSGQGVWVQPTNASMISPVFYEPAPPKVTGITLTIGSDDFTVRTLEFTNSVEIMQVNGPAGTFGVHYFLARRNPEPGGIMGSLVTDSKIKTDFDWWAVLTDNTEKAINIVLGSGLAGKQITINFPAVAFGNPDLGSDGAVQTLTLPFWSLESSGDDGVTMSYT